VLRLCPGCSQPTRTAGRCADCRRQYERERNLTQPRRRIRNLKRWQQTREAVKRRDGYACLACGATAPLEVHHRVKLRFVADPYDQSNLETLCISCHRKKDRRVD
jgi:5-methylcytosine-specific restriction endonuclease McrA